jgi:hypothetical protein
MLSPLSLLIAGFLQEIPQLLGFYWIFPADLLPKLENTKSHSEIPISVAFLL